jgi:hypothetical protein
MSVKKSSRFSFAFGLLSLVLCWFFWFPVYGIILTLLTLILSVLAIIYGRKIKKQQKNSLEMIDPACIRNAKFGRVMGAVGLFFSLICFVLSILSTIYFHFLIQ